MPSLKLHMHIFLSWGKLVRTRRDVAQIPAFIPEDFMSFKVRAVCEVATLWHVEARSQRQVSAFHLALLFRSECNEMSSASI